MKKLIAIILSLVMLLSLAACAPSEGATEPATDAPTEQPTEKPTDAPTDPPAPTDPEPTDPPTLQDSGICAVGIVDVEAGTAKILADNAVVAEIPYACESDLIPGTLYNFVKNGDVYDLTPVEYIYNDVKQAPRTFDNSYNGSPDQLYTHDGVNGWVYDLTEDCVVFIRFSETEYRLFKGSDVIEVSEWPCWMYFNLIPLEEELDYSQPDRVPRGYVSVMLVVGNENLGEEHAGESSSFFFDPEGWGWTDGDIVIE